MLSVKLDNGGGTRVTNAVSTAAAKVSEISMHEFEIRMRKTIQDLIAPSIERLARDRDAVQVITKTSESLVKRMSSLEESVYN